MKRLALSVIILFAMVVSIQSRVVRAENYFIQYDVPRPGTCSNTTWYIPTINATWQVPASPISAHIVEKSGDTLYADQRLDASFSGAGKQWYIGLPGASFNLPQPYTYTTTYDYYAGDKLISHAVIELHCRNNLATVRVINGDQQTLTVPYTHFDIPATGTCSNTTWYLPTINIAWDVPPAPVNAHIVEKAADRVVSDKTLSTGFEVSGVGKQWYLGMPSGTFNLQQPYSYVTTYDYSANGTIFSHVVEVVTCVDGIATGTILKGTNASVRGNFVLRTILCTIPIYSSAGGDPVKPEAMIKIGQTWFVNPTPVTDNHGKSWTEIFAGGDHNGFIPTSCVDTAPLD